MNKVLFKEEQQFRQWWYIVVILLSVTPLIGMGIYVLIQQGIKGIPVGDKPGPTWLSAPMILTAIGLLWMSYVMKLEVWIDQAGIHYRFFPMIRKERIITFAEIKKYEIRKYSPIIDYGGWGTKKSLRWGKAYNVSGDNGLQLYLNNGKKVLFGTQKPQAMIYAIDAAIKETQNNK